MRYSHKVKSGTTKQQSICIADSGASNHMTNDGNLLSFHEFFTIPKLVKIVNRSSLLVTRIGKIKLNNKLTLQNVLRVPTPNFNLLFVEKSQVTL